MPPLVGKEFWIHRGLTENGIESHVVDRLAFDGSLLQFIKLTAWGFLALACYVVAEGCQDGLLQRIHKARE